MFMDENVGVIYRNKIDNRLVCSMLILVCYRPITPDFLAVNFLKVLFLIYRHENKAHLKMINSQ